MKHSLVTTLIAVATIVAPVAAEAGCTLYQHRDYGGSRWGLDDYERMIMIDGEPLGCTTNGHGDGCESTTYNSSWNDHVSSFKVTSGCTLTMWEHINQGGARLSRPAATNMSGAIGTTRLLKRYARANDQLGKAASDKSDCINRRQGVTYFLPMVALIFGDIERAGG